MVTTSLVKLGWQPPASQVFALIVVQNGNQSYNNAAVMFPRQELHHKSR